jgi:hypothetical protein
MYRIYGQYTGSPLFELSDTGKLKTKQYILSNDEALDDMEKIDYLPGVIGYILSTTNLCQDGWVHCPWFLLAVLSTQSLPKLTRPADL